MDSASSRLQLCFPGRRAARHHILGFVHNGADRTLDPLHALRPAVPVAAPVRAPAVETAAATTTLDATLERRPWWKRWWLWLALLLLLLALLFGLRACAPNLVPGLSLPGSAPRDATLPDVKLSTPSLPHAGTSGMGIPGGAALTVAAREAISHYPARSVRSLCGQRTGIG